MAENFLIPVVMKRFFPILFLLSFFNAGAQIIPQDLPTIEALISLHKMMKKNEDLSITQNTTITAEQILTTEIASKERNVKDTLNKKLSDFNSYLMLAATVSNTLIRLESLIEEYSDFVSVSGALAAKKPFVAVYYAGVQKKLIKETSNLNSKIVTYTGSMLNIFKASMDEKFRLVYLIDGSITKMRSLIGSASAYIKYSDRDGIEKLDINDFYSDNKGAIIAEGLIEKWNANKF